MLQRPGCFVFYVLVAFIGLAMFIGWVNETRVSATEPAGFADGQQNVAALTPDYAIQMAQRIWSGRTTLRGAWHLEPGVKLES